MKYKIMFGLMIVLLSSFTFALGTGNVVMYHTDDSANISAPTVYDETGAYNGTMGNTPTTGVSGIINEAIDFDSASLEYVTQNVPSAVSKAQDFTVSLWFNASGTSAEQFIFGAALDANNRIFMKIKSNVIGVGAYEGAYDYVQTAFSDTADFHHLVLVGSSGSYVGYLDNIKFTDSSMTINGVATTTGSMVYGCGTDGVTQCFDGVIDEVAVFDTNLTASEVSELWNSGNGSQFPFSAPAPAADVNFTITAKDNRTSTSLNVFNTTITNSTGSWFYSTTTGTIVTNITQPAGLYNVTVRATNYSNYFSADFNASNNLTASLAPLFKINATDAFVGTTLTSFNATVNGTNYSTTSGEIVTNIPYNAGVVNISVAATNYSTRTYTNYNVSNDLDAQLTKLWYAATQYDTPVIEAHTQTFNLTLNISADVTSTSASFVYNGSSKTVTSTNNGTHVVYSATFVTDTVDADTNLTWNWSYSITSAAGVVSDYINGTQLVLVLIIDDCSSYTASIINFTLQDAVGGGAVTGNAQILFTVWNASTSITHNYSFSETGNSTFDYCIKPSYAIVTGDVHAEFTATNYSTKNYFAYDSYLQNVTQQITILMLNNTASQSVTVHVNDQNNDAIENALVEIYEYNLGTNNYTFFESDITDFNGEVLVSLQADTTYRFDIIVNGVTEQSKSIKIISTTTDLFFKLVSGGTTTLENYINIYNGMTHDLTYNSTTDVIQCTWSDPNAYASEFCLKVTQVNLTDDPNVVSLVCTTNVSAQQMNYTLTNYVNKTYIAICQAKSAADNLYYILDVLEIDKTTEPVDYGTNGILYSFFIIGTTTFLFYAINPAAAIMGLIFSTIVVKMFGLLVVSWAAIISLVVIGGILILLLKT